MRYSGLGQNFVQAGNMGAGGGGRLGSMIANYYGMRSRAELITHQANESIRVNDANNRSKTIYGAVGQEIGGHIKRNAVGSDYDMFNETFQDENDPRLKINRGKDADGNLIFPKVGDTVRPELREHSLDAGMINSSASASGITFGNTAGKDIAALREARKAKEDLKTTAKTKTPPPSGKKSKPKIGDSDFEGYTPRKTGTGGYDEAYKSGAIDKDTYDSYVEDLKKPGKDYMPAQGSNFGDTIIKERDNAIKERDDARSGNESSRVKTFDAGSNEHRSNVNDAWSSGKITTEEASDLSKSGSEPQKIYNEFPYKDNNDSIQENHKTAGLSPDKKGTQY